LMGVIPVGPGLIGTEPIDELLAGRYRVLRRARCTILCTRDVVSVPVHGHTFVNVDVAKSDLDQIALGGGDRRAGKLSVVGPGLDFVTGREPDGRGLRTQQVLAYRAAGGRFGGPA